MFAPFRGNPKQNEGQVLNKLDVFKQITDQVVVGLSNCQISKETNTKYYTRTLSNLLDKLFHQEDDDDDQVQDDRRMELVEKIIGNN